MHQIAGSLIMGLVLGGPALMLIILISVAILFAKGSARVKVVFG